MGITVLWLISDYTAWWQWWWFCKVWCCFCHNCLHKWAGLTVECVVLGSFFVFSLSFCVILPSVLSHCWMGCRKGIRPVNIWVVGAVMVISLGWGADLHMAQLMPLPFTITCSSKSRLVLPSWYRLTGIVQDKGPWNGCCFCVICVSLGFCIFCAFYVVYSFVFFNTSKEICWEVCLHNDILCVKLDVKPKFSHSPRLKLN